MRSLPWWRRFLGLYLASAWLLGIALAPRWPWPWVWFPLALVATAALLAGWRFPTLRYRLPAWMPVSLVLLFASLGGWRWAWAHRPQPEITYLQQLAQENREVRVVGLVIRPPRWKGERLQALVELHYLRFPWYAAARPARGRVLVSWPRERAPDLAYGDRIVLQGRLRQPPVWEDFDYRSYLERRGVYALMYAPRTSVLARNQGNPVLAAIFTLRKQGLNLVRQLWPDPEAGFFAGVLLGVDEDIPEPVYQAFRDTGTAHVIVISGFNIAVLSAVCLGLLRRLLPWKLAAPLTALVIAAYTVLVGADAAVVRAAIMGTLGLLARHLGRRQHGLTTLLVTAALMSLLWADVLWDVAFQLSFAATLGLILYGTRLVQAFERLARRWLPVPRVQQLSGPVGEFLLLTLAAQWTTLPVIVWHFGQLSLISPLANLLILPVQTPLMFLGGAALVLAPWLPPLGEILAWAAWPWTAYTIRVVEALATWPWASLPVERTWVLLTHGVLWMWLERRTFQGALPRVPPFPTPSRWVWLAALWALNALLTSRVHRLPDGNLHLWVLANAPGYALLIQTPSGAQVLIHGGQQGQLLNDALGRLLGRVAPLSWWVVVQDHNQALNALLAARERYPPTQILWLPRSMKSPAARRLRSWWQKQGIPVYTPSRGSWLDLSQGARLEILERGSSASTLRLSWRAFDLGLGLPQGWPQTLGAPELWLPLETCRALAFPRWSSTQATWEADQVLPCPPGTWLHLSTDGWQLWIEQREQP